MLLQPYLFFNGRCEEALTFFKQALGAEVTMLMRFKESPQPHPAGMLPEGWGDKVMHAELKIGEGATLLASDGHGREAPFAGFSLTLIVNDVADAERKFTALATGGEVRMPLAATFYSPMFGMLADKFGVGWMIYTAQPKP